ncbi:MAG: hypothetical protein IT385_09110 [Deltaproteobacteria bacterium]|nr:hypothetical protein [Deltaproteobacteria bacterium]
MDLYAELTPLIHELERDGLPYAICGAVALAIHGVPRATKDIDLLVPPDAIAGVLAVSRAGLVTLELAAGRPQDIADVERLAEVSLGGDDA